MRLVAKVYLVALATTCALIYFTYQILDRPAGPGAQQAVPFSGPAEPQAPLSDAAPAGQAPSTEQGQQQEQQEQQQQQPAQPAQPTQLSDQNDFKNRLVVFGDSSVSDAVFDDATQGRVWTNELCALYDCTLERYAQGSETSISVVDNGALKSSSHADLMPPEPLADFAAQVDAFLAAERNRTARLTDRAVAQRRATTVFAVDFGLWDVWRLIDVPEAEANKSINGSVAALFDQVARLVDAYDPADVRVVLAGALDVTFLPAYTAADGDRQAIEVSQRWNAELRRRTQAFNRASIFLVDAQSFVTEQCRLRELWANGYIESDEYSRVGRVPWLNVRDACIEGPKAVRLSASATCKDPERYLFWDSMHLGPAAHKLLAAEIYKDIRPLWLENKQV